MLSVKVLPPLPDYMRMLEFSPTEELKKSGLDLCTVEYAKRERRPIPNVADSLKAVFIKLQEAIQDFLEILRHLLKWKYVIPEVHRKELKANVDEIRSAYDAVQNALVLNQPNTTDKAIKKIVRAYDTLVRDPLIYYTGFSEYDPTGVLDDVIEHLIRTNFWMATTEGKASTVAESLALIPSEYRPHLPMPTEERIAFAAKSLADSLSLSKPDDDGKNRL